jgi:peptidoglycan/LPS O-acetylase OafA/YrhL
MLIIPDKKLVYAFIVVVIISQCFRLIHYLEPPVILFHSLSAGFEIAIGGLASWLMFFNAKAKSFFAKISSTTIVLIYILFSLIIFFQNYLFTSSQLILFVLITQLFGVFIILEQNYAEYSFIKIGNIKWISNLGKYSYGFFCYHILIIRLVETIAVKLRLKGVVMEGLIIPFTSLVLTILIGIYSYNLFEVYFLNLKKKFTYLKD